METLLENCLCGEIVKCFPGAILANVFHSSVYCPVFVGSLVQIFYELFLPVYCPVDVSPLVQKSSLVNFFEKLEF